MMGFTQKKGKVKMDTYSTQYRDEQEAAARAAAEKANAVQNTAAMHARNGSNAKYPTPESEAMHAVRGSGAKYPTPKAEAMHAVRGRDNGNLSASDEAKLAIGKTKVKYPTREMEAQAEIRRPKGNTYPLK